MSTAKISRTSIVKAITGEWQVKAWDKTGKRLPMADYFTDDRDDAEDTAKAMVTN